MRKFEYLAFQRAVHETEMNELGAKGWELVAHSVATTSSAFGGSGFGQYYVFKREKL
jgi:hypothetical protein